MTKTFTIRAEQAAARIRVMSLSARRWFASDFDRDTDLSHSEVADLCAVHPDWVAGCGDLTPLGLKIHQQLRGQDF